jgi:hypothetical protein
MRERADNQPLASGSGANPLVNLPDPKVIKIDKDPSARPDPLLDWRVLYLDCLCPRDAPG